MEHHPVLGDKDQDGNGINDSLCGWVRVYAGSSWWLQKTKTALRVVINRQPVYFIVSHFF